MVIGNPVLMTMRRMDVQRERFVKLFRDQYIIISPHLHTGCTTRHSTHLPLIVKYLVTLVTVIVNI